MSRPYRMFASFLKHLASGDSPATSVRVCPIHQEQEKNWPGTIQFHFVILVHLETDAPVICLFSDAECNYIVIGERLSLCEVGIQNLRHSMQRTIGVRSPM